jgi:hypothetical protein
MTIRELRATLAAIDPKYDGCRVLGAGQLGDLAWNASGPSERLTQSEEIVFVVQVHDIEDNERGAEVILMRPRAAMLLKRQAE